MSKSQSREYKPSSRGELIKSLSERSGLNQRVLWAYSKDGCNLESDDDVRAYLDTLDKVPSTVKSSFWRSPNSSENFHDDNRDLEALKKELLLTRDKNEAATLKIQLEGLKAAQQLEILNGSYIAIQDVESIMVRIGAELRSLIIKMQSELPPILNGMTPAQMQKKLGEYAENILSVLSSFRDKVDNAPSEDE